MTPSTNRSLHRRPSFAALLGASALALAGCADAGSSSDGTAISGAVIATVPTHHEVARVDLGARRVTARAQVSVPGFVAVNPARPRIYVGSASHDLVALDAVTLAVVTSVPAQGIRDIVVAPDGARVFTLSASAGRAVVEARDPVSLEAVASLDAPASVAGRAPYAAGSLLTIDPLGRRLALAAPGAVWLMDPASFGGVSIALPAGFLPSDAAFTLDGAALLVGGRDDERRDGRLYAIDVVNGGVSFVVDGGTADYIAVAPTADAALVTGSFFGLSGVGRVDLAARALMTGIPDDRVNFPTDLAVGAGGRVLVAASNLLDGRGLGRVALYDARTLAPMGSIGLPGATGHVVEAR